MISNITNYKNIGDWFYIIVAVLVVDFVVIVKSKYGDNKNFNVNSLNTWYDKFGLAAVSSDVLSILIGIAVARYIYTFMKLSNPLYFILILVAFQLFHDVCFYLAVIKQLPTGHNSMIDVFKGYSEENGTKILIADALMMISSVLLGSFLKSIPTHFTSLFGLITTYSLCYIIYTRSPITK
jgi:hypothetical protein